jgi:hypothetical protein
MGSSGNGRPPTSRPTPLTLVNRDWTVSVECRAEGVIVYPGSKRFDPATLATVAGAASLTEAVQQLAARRQATVRPGEAPYRIQIRFLMRPNGLRSFYLAYPALEGLNLPMMRQNIDADEEIK